MDASLRVFRRLMKAPILEAKRTGTRPKGGLGHIFMAVMYVANPDHVNYVAGSKGKPMSDAVRADAFELLFSGDMASGESRPNLHYRIHATFTAHTACIQAAPSQPPKCNATRCSVLLTAHTLLPLYLSCSRSHRGHRMRGR